MNKLSLLDIPAKKYTASSKSGRNIFNLFLRICLLCVFISIAWPAKGYCKSGRIESVTVESINKSILVNARLVKGLSNHLGVEIQRGLQKDLFYYIVLKSKKKNWIDEEIKAVTIKYSIRYDLLKKQFHIQQFDDDKKIDEHIFQDFQDVKNFVSRINKVKIAELNELSGKKRYYVIVKAVMTAKKLPLYMDYLFFFIPNLELDTPWTGSFIIN